MSAPTFSAWVGAGALKPSDTIGAHRLFSVCRELGVCVEWVLYGELPKYQRERWPFAFSRDSYERLDQREKEEISEFAMFKISRNNTKTMQQQQTMTAGVSRKGSDRKLSSSIDEALDAANHLLGSQDEPSQRKPGSSKP